VVDFTAQAMTQLRWHEARWPDLPALLCEVLAQDPRPAYANDALRQYGFRLYDLEVKWRCTGARAIIEEIVMATAERST